MRRAAFVCADRGVPVFGAKGCSIHAQAMLRALGEAGVELEIIAAREGGDPPPELARLGFYPLEIEETDDPALREQRMIGVNEKLRELLERLGPFDFVYERHSLFSHAAMEYAAQAGIPGLLEVNAPLVEEQSRHRVLVHRSEAESSSRRSFGAASHLLPVSEEIARFLSREGVGTDRIHVVPNGVDTQRVHPELTPTLHKEPGSFTVGFVGTLRPWHGVRELAEGFALLCKAVDGARLLVVGAGSERETLELDLERLGVRGRATFTGAVAHDEVPGLLASMDVGVAPYPPQPDFYFSPLKVLEYMAAGLPVVASRIGQIPMLVRDEDDGLLHEPGDSAAMAKALTRLAQDRTLRRTLGCRARASVVESRSWQSVARRVLALASGGEASAPEDQHAFSG